MKTPERIVQASLELFNQQGERSVSTNHIAAHLEISPGNLYYHFANKQAIVAVLFERYQAAVRKAMQLPEGRAPGIGDLSEYLTSLLELLWQYRFFYRDLEHLLASDEVLAGRYRVFSRQCVAQGGKLVAAFNEAGVVVLSERQAEALTLNLWIVLTAWVRYRCTSGPQPAPERDVIRRGCYQVLSLIHGLVQPAWRGGVESLMDEFFTPLMMGDEQGLG
ncbi:TetR/AcrR family transcriptional regulator [Pseudomonas sp. KNUC1026]|uniref:TetR/AcrR family transcriptional regulator n=1 Tax=Pseudomonas sp. KNUC1026 TaxID=2893890 RepID=UPI001F1D84AC|nr:TetR/AcrR family transcriptional regulator [Pseudomonas sp. KNUC1026]UFH49648.1 TetR/AcrR family transcriptional regulator [Pseudomonas sp. KNUC1026]